MAFKLDLSKLNFFSRLDARSRVFVIFGVILGIVGLIYVATKVFSNGDETTGPSRVAEAPAGLQSVPGSKSLTPEYERAIVEQNAHLAQQAKVESVVPTMLNQGTKAAQAANNTSCIICSDQSANVGTLMEDWKKQGKITPDVMNQLKLMADKNIPLSEYSAQLDQLVKDGKITPEQSRLLLQEYKKQHTNANMAESEKTMDAMIKTGLLSTEVANQLLEAQRNGVSPEEYSKTLDGLVAQGKISPDVAQQLLAQYNKQYQTEAAQENMASVNQMAKSGELTPDMAKTLNELTTRGASVDEYSAVLQKAVSEGRLTPAAAGKLLDTYKNLKLNAGPSTELVKMTKAADEKLNTVINKLADKGASSQLKDLAARNIPPEEFAAQVGLLARSGKISIEEAKQLADAYQASYKVKQATANLATLQANNSSLPTYVDELKKLIAAGAITPEEASRLMLQYKALLDAKSSAPGSVVAPVGGNSDFADLQRRLQKNTGANSTLPSLNVNNAQFEEKQAQAATQAAQEQQARIGAMVAAMSGQAQQLVASWQPPTIGEKVGSPPAKKTGEGADGTGSGSGSSGSSSSSSSASSAASLIKAGDVLFAVLDTAVNSDYPDSPVMATIVSGKYKGAKLLGKLMVTKSVAGQMDRVSLNFTLMNQDAWPQSKTVTAYAIDPDTARTALASNVDYHYMMRFGAMMATSFMQGYGNAITSSGATSTTGVFGTSTTNPELSPSQKIATALGQVGKTLGEVTQGYAQLPPTVKVDSGVGLGILFMSDVT